MLHFVTIFFYSSINYYRRVDIEQHELEKEFSGHSAFPSQFWKMFWIIMLHTIQRKDEIQSVFRNY